MTTDEGVKVAFETLPDRVSEGAQDETTVSIDDDDNPHVTVQFTQDEYTVVEGSNVGVRVRLSADPERTVSIPITATNQEGRNLGGLHRAVQRELRRGGDGEDVHVRGHGRR